MFLTVIVVCTCICFPLLVCNAGSVGATRDHSSPKLYISSDGGHTWYDPGLPVGTYSYGIGDYGNIIAVAPDSENIPYMWCVNWLLMC